MSWIEFALLPESGSATCEDCSWTASGPRSRYAADEHCRAEHHTVHIHTGPPKGEG